MLIIANAHVEVRVRTCHSRLYQTRFSFATCASQVRQLTQI